ncbi:histidinol-phosphatase HisJ family protein [Helicobacter muridarum]|uniref:Histidinol-phosphatase n=1 Tax=Helicobacter muridarum TaxID=216 RepID=A0A099U1M7_9HELI|nr:histidinol-phosphatase [Helicobacter muridarum]TLE00731.1 histidinol-phosphatase HisJ family protein [Helicobacter muridarum]STQ86593.1 histidinol-phosphatase [Helicobacter muridarum]
MRVDLHNHTTYCNHATGSMREYINKAQELGINVFGFSCHAPMDFDSKYRMSFDILPKYLEQVSSLKDEFDDIEILCALEVDYILGREDLLSKEVLNASCDYLIGSVHFLDKWGFDNPEFIGEWSKRGVHATWNCYLDSIESLLRSGYFQIIGHLDLPKIFGSVLPRNLLPRLYDILQIAKTNDIVIEVNAAGLRKPIKEQYPSIEILNMIKKLELDITLSSDAHRISEIGFGYLECLNIIKDIGFTNLAIFRDKTKHLVNIN